MTGSIRANVEAVDKCRIQAVLGWGELAAKAGISTKVITRLRRGEVLSPRTLRALGSALGVKPAELVQVPDDRGRKAASAASA
jgi:DNA-binding Xre family transcriptional regulator